MALTANEKIMEKAVENARIMFAEAVKNNDLGPRLMTEITQTLQQMDIDPEEAVQKKDPKMLWKKVKQQHVTLPKIVKLFQVVREEKKNPEIKEFLAAAYDQAAYEHYAGSTSGGETAQEHVDVVKELEKHARDYQETGEKLIKEVKESDTNDSSAVSDHLEISTHAFREVIKELQETKRKHTLQIAKMKQELQRMQIENRTAACGVDKNKGALTSLQEEIALLEEASDKAEKVTLENERLKEEIAKLKMQEKSSEIERLERENEQLKEKIELGNRRCHVM